MARDGGVLGVAGERVLDAVGEREQAVEVVRDVGAEVALVLDEPEHGEGRRQRRAGVEGAQRPRDLAEHLRPPELVGFDRGRLEERADQDALGGQPGDHRRPDAELGRRAAAARHSVSRSIPSGPVRLPQSRTTSGSPPSVTR